MAVDDEHTVELTTWAASDAPSVRPHAHLLRGEDARAASRALLDDAADGDAESQALLQRAGRGRPPVDPADVGRGASPRWTLRAPRALDAAVRSIAAQQGRQPRDVIRDAAAEYVERHAAG